MIQPVIQPLPSSALRTRGFWGWLRWLGGGLSLACAVHCALMPLVLLLMPALKLTRTGGALLQGFEQYEIPIVCVGLLLSAVSLWAHTHGHFSGRVWAYFGAAVVCNVLGLSLAHDAALWHPLLMIAGGAFLLTAALKNAWHQHPH
jgi:hypothetical protein